MDYFNMSHCWCQEPTVVVPKETEAATGQSSERPVEDRQVTQTSSMAPVEIINLVASNLITRPKPTLN